MEKEINYVAGSLNVDLLVPDETELALIGGLETLFECGVKTIVATSGADTRFALLPSANVTLAAK